MSSHLDSIASILEMAYTDYKRGIDTNSQKEAIAYACRSIAASCFLIASLMALRSDL